MSNDASAAACKAAQEAILTPTSTTYYVGLNTGDPSTTGANEGTDGRQSTTMGTSTSAVPSVQVSTASQTWSSAVGGQTYTYLSIWDASTSGNYKRKALLSSSITPPAGAQITIASGAISLSMGV